MSTWTPPASDARKTGRGILLMVAAVSMFACMDTIAKWLSATYPVPMIVWSRYFFQMLVMLAVLGPRMGRSLVITKIPGMQVTRGIVLTCSSLTFFSALSHMPLAEASTITFISPLLIAVLAGPLLGERSRKGTWTTLVFGFAGVLCIIRPGTSIFTWYALLPVATACMFATYQLMTRRMAGRDPAVVTLFYPALVGSCVVPIVFPAAMQFPQAGFDAALFIGLGVLGGVGHYLLIKAFEKASAPTLAPFLYGQIVTVLILSYLVFGHFPDGWSLVGMGVIVASGLSIALRYRSGG